MSVKVAPIEKTDEESILTKILDVIAGSFAPILGVLAGAGLLKALLALFSMMNLLSEKSGTYLVLTAAGNALFYFLPVFLGITIANKLGANGFVGGAIGASLLEPNFTELAGKATFFGWSIQISDYSASIFPIFIAISFYALLDRLLRKIIYKEVQLFINPLISLVLIVPLTVLVFGPFGNWIGSLISVAIEFLIAKSGILTGAILGGAWTFLTILGLHWALIPLAIANLATGTDNIIPLGAPAVFAQLGMATALFIKSRDKDLKSLALSGLVPGALAGTTEILYYGIVIRYRKVIPIIALAGAIGGAISGFFGVRMREFVLPSLLSIPAFTPILSYLLALTTAYAIAFVLILLFGYESENENVWDQKKNPYIMAVKPEKLYSPLIGTIIPLSRFQDPLFATGQVGKGIAIAPQRGEVYAPTDGVVTSLFPTNHAIGITTEQGAEVLIFIGVDTVHLKGECFTPHVRQGDSVKRGQLLLTFDQEMMKQEGYPTTTAVVVTNSSQYIDVKPLRKNVVDIEDALLDLQI